MTSIKGKRILLGVTGGIAAYKAVELARIMVKAGVDLRVAMTDLWGGQRGYLRNRHS